MLWKSACIRMKCETQRLYTCSTKSTNTAKGIGDPKRHEVSVKYLLCDVLGHHIGWIRSSRYLLDWNNTRSNKFLNEKKSKLNMFRLLGSSKPSSHWLACSAVSMNSNVHIFGKLGLKKKWPNEQAFRHSKSYCVQFSLSAGKCDCRLRPALRGDQSAEKVQGHSGSASSWSSTTCPVGVHIGVDVESCLLGMRNDLRSKCQNHRFGSCQVPYLDGFCSYGFIT